VSQMARDLRYAFRTIGRSRLAFVVTIVSLGLGIAVVTAVFSMANALFLRPPAGLAHPERLAALYTSRDDGRLYGSTSFPDYTSLVDGLDAFDGVAATSFDGLKLDDGQRSLLAEMVTGNYFTVLGVRPALGRTFLPDETVPGRARRVVVISYDLWQQQFNGDPQVAGRTLRLNGHVHEIVGVAPQGLVSRLLALRPDLWVPLGIPGESTHRTVEELERRTDREFRIVGRLRDGQTLGDVRAQLSVVEARLRAAYPDAWKDPDGRPRRLSVLSERDSRIDPEVRGVFAGVALFFLGVAVLILLIACSNVMGLFLAQAGRRRREIAVRLALGASRRQIVAMLLTEGLVPGLASGALGLILATYAMRAMETVPLPLGIPVRFDFSPDLRVLAFAVLTAIGASLTFSLVPALQASRPELAPALKSDTAGLAGRRRRFSLRNAVVVVQFATTVVLLAGAVLFLRSLQGALHTDFGIRTDRIAVMTRQLPGDDGTPEARVAYIRALRARLAALPGVEDVAVSRGVELTMAQIGTDVRIAKEGAAPDASRDGFRNSVTPGYLEMLGVSIVRGRSIAEGDVAGAPLVAVANETMARRFWPGEDPLGRRFALAQKKAFDFGGSAEPQVYQVVGVARDGKYVDIDDGPVPYCWTSIYQDDARLVTISVKGVESAAAMVSLLREHGEASLDEVALVSPSTLASQVSLQFMPLRVAARVLGWGGLFGLVLALVGIYGVVAFAVTQRTREMAIRVAVGASGGQVLGRIVRDALRLAAVGLAIGLGVALPLAPLTESFMFGVSPIDPLSFGGTVALLLLAALVAALVPARRALRIDPIAVLRDE
jgi:predicted permease